MGWDNILNTVEQLAQASLQTMALFSLTLIISLPLGLLMAFGRMSRIRPISWLMRGYLLVMRGTPLMLQLIFFMYGLNLPFSRFQVAVVAFSLNYAAYFAEIYRGGIEGVPSGQREAANVLGFSKGQTFFRVILPQVIKKIMPPMGNEFMTLVKDTSLAQMIGVAEISLIGYQLQQSYVSMVPIVIAGVFYLVMNSVVSRGFSVAEKRLGYYS
ncbi:MAG: amino acid ABC transporter permease [Oscillospiraceae bacterium]|jgi:polar amino acid transport system permease protein|nr:amino acid ABC transporter permease [Oscillospiraceae bacterium]MDD3832275.1 amino acid ABC transporter permease [Oscillospiraceae bacterium]